MAKKEMALKSKSTTYEKKTVGIVQVVVGEKVAKLTLTDDKKTFKSTGSDTIKIKLADLPKYPKLKKGERLELRARMNSDDTKVEAFGPVRGLHPAKLFDVGPRPEGEDSDPIPFEKFFNKGEANENSHLEFFAVYRITEGRYKGCEGAYYLHYKFEEDDDEEGLTQFSFNTENPKATRGQQLLEWGYIHGGGAPGIWGEPIPWDDETILPELFERAQENDIEVNLVFDKGYIQSIQPADDGYAVEDDELEDVDEAFPPGDDEDDEVEDAPKPKKVRKPRKAQDDDEDL